MSTILFVSLDAPTIEALADAFRDLSHIVTCSVVDIRGLEFDPGTMFMSPANSIGFMDGGLDAAYMTMFPGVQPAVQAKIRDLGRRTNLGRFYLPVGSAVVVSVGAGYSLVSAPTMFLPHDVSTTRNAYHAMMAALMAFKKQESTTSPYKHLVCSGLCCGYGRMNPVVSAKQIREAYDDFTRGVMPTQIERVDDPSFVVTQSRDDEQPDNYDNREIRPLRPDELTTFRTRT